MIYLQRLPTSEDRWLRPSAQVAQNENSEQENHLGTGKARRCQSDSQLAQAPHKAHLRQNCRSTREPASQSRRNPPGLHRPSETESIHLAPNTPDIALRVSHKCNWNHGARTPDLPTVAPATPQLPQRRRFLFQRNVARPAHPSGSFWFVGHGGNKNLTPPV